MQNVGVTGGTELVGEFCHLIVPPGHAGNIAQGRGGRRVRRRGFFVRRNALFAW